MLEVVEVIIKGCEDFRNVDIKIFGDFFSWRIRYLKFVKFKYDYIICFGKEM